MDENPYKAPGDRDRGRASQPRSASDWTVIFGVAGCIVLGIVIVVAAYRFITDLASALGHS